MRYAFLLIKHHAVRARDIGAILRDVEVAGFRIRALKMVDTAFKQHLVEALYMHEHGHKPYYRGLIDSVTGRIVVCVLEHPVEDSIDCIRALAGATDPKNADPHTLRHRYGNGLPQNAVHSSDSPEKLIYETSIFFSYDELPDDFPEPGA